MIFANEHPRVHTISYICYVHNDIAVDIGMKHLEDFDGMFAYHILFGHGAITLCSLEVRSMDVPHLWHVVHEIKICNILIHANQDVGIGYGIGFYN